MKHRPILFFGFVAGIALTGCIDNKYDLSDIDTTSEFKVKDLVLPIELDPVQLSDIIHVKEGDQIKEVTIGESTFYAIEQVGEFNSDGINVNDFEVDPKPTEQQTADFKREESSSSDKEEIYKLGMAVINELEYSADDIDGALKSLSKITFEQTEFSVEISASNLSDGAESEISDIELTYPKGLSVINIQAGDKEFPISSYDPGTGKVNLQDVPMDKNKTKITVYADAVDLNGYSDYFTYDEAKEKGRLQLTSVLNINSCEMTVKEEGKTRAAAENIAYNVSYDLGEMKVKSVLGKLQYNLEGTGLNIEPINLENVPSFLENPETNLILSNPQIYLRLKNQIGEYGLSYQSSLNIIAQRENSQEDFLSPLIKLPPIDGEYNYLLAPDSKSVVNIPQDYSGDIERLDYNNLGEILASKEGGLPKMIDLQLVDPEIPEQTLTSLFELGQSVPGMEGQYTFLAPLSLQEGSKIVKKVDGWWSEDLSDLTINVFTLTANATSDVPMDVILTVYPIDKDGKKISTSSEATLKLPQGAKNQPIELTMEGIIKDLDGVEIYVLAGSDDDTPLAPDQVITLDNIRAKVSGNYTRKL